ncbi:hypothetical protein SUGI_0117500 [Cryptomeria japonica]|uniref:uncharacterized protein LOC131036362 n=1 Tax=Cryptomeria japonica TaxID=3369 RepID=UPI002408AA18|nr:uncharacterized protein LOC131036362 [Cryptomeria japonica]XP_057824211.2 uncharacterized protein LOC131036362 [Cryptomeria japonica]GLJ09876.1 hypothetical protein SUGI_0117500 [Cryptomeria japonica]
MGEVATARITAPLFPSSDSNGSMEGRKIIQGATAGKRKTPSELRAEQFKRMRGMPNEVSKSLPTQERLNTGNVSEPKKAELCKPPRYIDTHVHDVYPVTKPGDKLKLLGSKGKSKDSTLLQNQKKEFGETSSLSNEKISSTFSLRRNRTEALPDYVNSSTNCTLTCENVEETSMSVNYNKFLNVAELSKNSQVLASGTTIDMDKALKGLANNKVATATPATHDLPGSLGDSVHDFPSNTVGHEVQIDGDKIPLDLSLKASMRLVSSSPLKWCHQMTTTSEFMGMKEFIFSLDSLEDSFQTNNKVFSNCTNVQVSFWQALHSWVHPQSTLPSSLISTMALSAARGGAVEDEFLSKRLSSWEDSFRSIYYMFRKRMCNIFYFCTQQFIVMFMNSDIESRCAAYLTRSTRGLRALLKKHDVGFSMPLCGAEIEQVTMEDLHELSEFEKTNPGQTQVVDSMVDVDNSSQSLLAFVGNVNVHGLYDFLLNHRSLLSSVACVDVPVLCSPVPFKNASLHVPKVSCKQIKRLDAVPKASIGGESVTTDSHESKSSVAFGDMSYAIEIKDTFLPPWVVSKICATIVTDKKNFEASFVTEQLSDGLNIALEFYCGKGNSENSKVDKIHYNGSLKDAVCSPSLRWAFTKNLKYTNGSYLASLSYI